MTLDETIQEFEKYVERSTGEAHYWGEANEEDLMNDAIYFAEYYQQLAKWLKELKELREFQKTYLEQYRVDLQGAYDCGKATGIRIGRIKADD